MFARLHLLSPDEPGGRRSSPPVSAHVGAVSRDPQVFEWNQRQREDLEALWRDPDAEGAHRTHLYCALTSMT